MQPDLSDPRAFLTMLFQTDVARADPMTCVPPHLPPRPAGRLAVIGAGKASARMAGAVEAVYGPCEGLVITRYGYGRPCQGINVVEAAHPVPDQAGVDATRRMLDLVATLGCDDQVIGLISGGGSSLLCAPVEGVTLADKQALNAALLASGVRISGMNIVRKQVSAVKGGKLAAACAPARLLSLVLSDVPGDDLSEIASGPTVAGRATAQEALALIDRWHVPLPDNLRAVIAAAPPPIAQADPRLASATATIVAAPSQSLDPIAFVACHASTGTSTGIFRRVPTPNCKRLRHLADRRCNRCYRGTPRCIRTTVFQHHPHDAGADTR